MQEANIENEERGRVACPVRRKWVALTPEEVVRQEVLLYLHHSLGYPYELMQVEGTIELNGMRRRCDIVLFDHEGRAKIIVECKRGDVPLTQAVCDQACRYNTVLRVPWLLLTNGVQSIVLHVDEERRCLEQREVLPRYHKNG